MEYVVKVPEPVLSHEEMSEAIGRLTMTCESLRNDIVALERKQQGSSPSPSLSFRIRSWIVGKLAADLIKECTTPPK